MKKTIEANVKNSRLIEEKRQLIIKAANKLFIKHGFHKTKTLEIANQAGITEGTLYNYIRRKDDILFLMHEDLQKKLTKKIDLGLKKGTDARSRLENVLGNMIDILMKNHKTVRMIFIETASQTKISLEILLKRESEIIEKIAELIEEGARNQLVKVENPRLSASMIHYLMFYHCLNNWDIKTMNVTNDEIKTTLLTVIFQILGVDQR